MKLLAITVCLLSCLVICGCHKSDDVVGKWSGVAGSGTNSPADQFASQLAKNMTLELKSDHTFTMNVILTVEGTWAQSGQTVSLTMTKMMGTTPSGNDKPMELTLSSDGQTLTGTSKTGPSGGITFKRDK